MKQDGKTGKRHAGGRPKGKPRTPAEIAADALRTGRPAFPDEARQSVFLSVRFTPVEHRRFLRDAKRAGLTASAYAKQCWRIARQTGRKET